MLRKLDLQRTTTISTYKGMAKECKFWFNFGAHKPLETKFSGATSKPSLNLELWLRFQPVTKVQSKNKTVAGAVFSMTLRSSLLFVSLFLFLEQKTSRTLCCQSRTLTSFIEPQEYTHKNRAQPTNAKYDCQLFTFCTNLKQQQCACCTVNPNAS